MDPLSDVLGVVRLDGAYFYAVEAAAPWSVAAPPSRQLTPRILPQADHLIPYHVLTSGRCLGGAAGGELVEMEPGDVLVFPHGDGHVMTSDRGLMADPGTYHVPGRFPQAVAIGAGAAPTATFVCGFLGCDLRPFNPLIASLPRQLHVRGLSTGWLELLGQQVLLESQAGRAGAQGVLTRLAELMFIEVVRRHLDALPPGQSGWLAGLRDDLVGRVLALIHAQPEHPWTLPELATRVAASRSRLVERFTALVGEPPMTYLTRWRMQVASASLLQSDAKVSAVGLAVGYASEAAFSRAFKQASGMSPGEWRKARRQSDK